MNGTPLNPESAQDHESGDDIEPVDSELQMGKVFEQLLGRLPEYREQKDPVEFAREMGVEISPDDQRDFRDGAAVLNFVPRAMEPFLEVLDAWAQMTPEQQAETTPTKLAVSMGVDGAIRTPETFEALFSDFLKVREILNAREEEEG